MLRKLSTATAIALTALVGAWAYTDMTREANATTGFTFGAVNIADDEEHAELTTVSATETKGDRLAVAEEVAKEGCFPGTAEAKAPQARIIQAHLKALEEQAQATRYMTLSIPGRTNETVLVKVPVKN